MWRRSRSGDDQLTLRRRVLHRIPRHWLRRLPRRVAVPVLSEVGWPRRETRDERDVEVPEPFRLRTYWVRVGDDEGPAASLFFSGDEILRIDLLGPAPHVHYGLAESRARAPFEPRVYLPPAPVEELIDRAVYELGHNVAFCTGLDRRRRVRATPIGEAAFGQAAEEAGAQLRALVAAHAG